MTAVPLHVWDIWIKEMEDFLKHPDNIEQAKIWSKDKIIALPLTDVMWEIFNAGEKMEDDIESVDIGQDDEHMGEASRNPGERRRSRSRSPSSGHSNNTNASSSTGLFGGIPGGQRY